jgi:putative hydrolase of the HAD superfamily
MGVRAVLFDFGHTLMDFGRTEDALRGAYSVIRDRLATWVEDRAPPEVDELVERIAEEVDKMVERSFEQRRLEELDIVAVFNEAFSALGYKLPAELMREVIELDHDALRRSVKIDVETIETLEKLRADGYKLGLVSNVAQLPELLHEDIETFGLRKLLDGIAFSSEIGVRKPRPQIFEAALDQVGVPARDAVFVGDRLTDDIAGAQAVGMKAILTQQYRKEEPGDVQPDAVITHVTEVPSAIASW